MRPDDYADAPWKREIEGLVMKIYVGVTDGSWYDYLRDHQYDEVNFWKPSGKTFKAIQEGDLFLFKLKADRGGRIAGGGFFTKYLTMSVDWAWRAFGNENGVNNLAQLSDAIDQYRAGGQGTELDVSPSLAQIGCAILNDVFFFDEDDWFEVPGDPKRWRSIVSGKTYSTEEADGRWLFDQVEMRLKGIGLDQTTPQVPTVSGISTGERYAQSLTRHRLGQGAFRALVADAYHNRCAITGERTLPVLQAAHIRPYSQEGPHAVCNGMFLRSDLHTLFDDGYLTVTPDYTVHVSRHLHDDYNNGRIYYAYQGKKLEILPENPANCPSRDYLVWHNDTVYLG